MQTKMISNIIKGKINRDDDILEKIKIQQALKKSKSNFKSTSKNKSNKFPQVYEEYNFLTTENNIKQEKEEYKKNTTNFSKHENNQEDENIKVTENIYIDENQNLSNSKNFKNNKFQNSKISQTSELFEKKLNESNDKYGNKNNQNLISSNRGNLMNNKGSFTSYTNNNLLKGKTNDYSNQIENNNNLYEENLLINENANVLFNSTGEFMDTFNENKQRKNRNSIGKNNELNQKENKDDNIDSNYNSLKNSNQNVYSQGKNIFINNLKNSSNKKSKFYYFLLK